MVGSAISGLWSMQCNAMKWNGCVFIDGTECVELDWFQKPLVPKNGEKLKYILLLNSDLWR